MVDRLMNFFKKSIVIENDGVKYSVLLEKFMTPFKENALQFEDFDEFIDFSILAWNFGNMKSIVTKDESNNISKMIKAKDEDSALLLMMIEYKVANFKKYTNFIVDFELTEKDNEPFLKVMTEQEASYLANMLENENSDVKISDFDSNYIDRKAITLKPLQPFFDPYHNLHPEDINRVIASSTYLISEDAEEETWLRKKFDKIFMIELEGWHSNKKEWPQKRSYKMFTEWFQADISTVVYDLENQPIRK